MQKWMLWAGAVLLVVVGAISWLFLSETGQAMLFRYMIRPSTEFAAVDAPPAPNYGNPDSWSALPGVADNSDLRPAGEPLPGLASQQNHPVDVFFVQPTTFISGKAWNATLHEEDANYLLESIVLPFQASAYNLCCRVYAPRYRQATLFSFFTEAGENGNLALDLAYQDVKQAFDFFIKHYNNGRPFILASHSQGSLHGKRLLEEYILTRPDLRRRMVAAYLIGYSVPMQIGGGGLAPCDAPDETGCYINWNAVASTEGREGWLETTKLWENGTMGLIAGRKIACVNPLNWRVGGGADAPLNTGALRAEYLEETLPPLIPQATGATCAQGLLLVTLPEGEFVTSMVNDGDYHIFDYHLFYDNIRQNTLRRTKAFLARRQ